MRKLSHFLVVFVSTVSILAVCHFLSLPSRPPSGEADIEGLVVCMDMRVYPQGASPGCLLVNNQEAAVSISRDVCLEKETETGWTVLPEPIGESIEAPMVIESSRVFHYSVAHLTDSLEEPAGHYRVTFQEYDSDTTFRTEFWVAEEWDWNVLDLEDVLSPSPFTSTVQLDSETDVRLHVGTDCDQTDRALVFSYSITNNSNRTIQLGQEQYVEILLDGTAYLTPISGWDAAAYTVSPGQTMSLHTYLITQWTASPRYDSVTAVWPQGTYRLIVPATILEDEESGTGNKVFFSAAFSLEQAQ